MQLRIKEIIKEKGTTIQNIADSIGINRVSLTNSINGNPTVDTLLKIADALEVPITELFCQSQDEAIIGIVRYKNKPYEINSIEDIENLLAEIKEQT